MVIRWRARNRKVRLHFTDRQTTIEGHLAAETRRDYVIWMPKVLEQEGTTVDVSGHVEVPRENVLFVQVIG